MIRLLILATLVFSSPVASAQCTGLLDAPPVQLPFTFSTIADFDGDGDPDLLSGNAIHYGAAGSTFSAPVPIFDAALKPVAFDVADMNGDGRLDIVLTWEHTGSIFGTPVVQVGILFNQGNRSFSPPQFLDLGVANPAVGDFTGDGHPDVLVIEPINPEILYVFDRGRFVPAASSEIGNPARVIAADADGDGNLDVVAASGNEWRAFLGDGAGLFFAGAVLATDAREFLIDDIDGDGFNDVVFTPQGVQRVLVRFGGPATTELRLSPRALPDRILLADFDGDDDLDLAMTAADATVTIFMNDGGRGLTRRNAYPVARTDVLGAADFDGDGHVDLLVGAGRGHAILHGAGDGTFDAARSINGLPSVSALRAGNVDGRTFDELVMVNAANEVVVADVAGTLVRLPVQVEGETFLDVRGNEVLTGNGTQATVLRRNPDGTWVVRRTVITQSPIEAVALIDVDRDGTNEVALVQGTSDGGALSVFGSSATTPLFEAGIGPFVWHDLRAADLNGDGNEDLVFTGGSETSTGPHGAIDVFHGAGGGVFLPPVSFTDAGSAFVEAGIGDFNGDGIDDHAAVSHGAASVTVHFGGVAGLSRTLLLPGPDTAAARGSIATGDIDNDRIDDIVVIGSDIKVYRGSRSGLVDAGTYLMGRNVPSFPHLAVVAHIENGLFRSVVVQTPTGFAATRPCNIAKRRSARH
ncbi:MAG TPA: VCBS repeat-containing protein [Thermoanaerobaculia bacterium]|nr:VCBS repeat-containing protein [Thermoanaerobaculia bacterium]